jgi:hydrogenase maturation factor HypF (carbamoyltransferase family)
MPVKQTIKYNSDNKYFAGFLQELINISDIEGSVSFENKKITLLIENSDEDKLNIFNENINKYLPASIFIGDIETVVEDSKIEKSNFISPTYDIAPCAKCLELLTNPASQHYLDGSLKCTHYSNEDNQEFEDFTTFSPHYSKGSSVLITDASKVNDLFIVTEDEIQMLFSIEKPTIKVTIKDETLKNLTGKNYIYIKLPYNNRSALAALNAKESEVDYLFFNDNDDLKMVVIQKNKTIIKASRVATQLENLNNDNQINRFLNIKKEANFQKGAICANLDTNGINFIVSNEVDTVKVIKFQDFKFANFIYGIHNDGIRLKLMDNFYKKYPHIEEKLVNIQEIGLYEFICLILDIDEKSYQGSSAFESLCDKSYEFRGNGGLKIDMFYSTEGFDYTSFLSSIMSFRLAGAEIHYIVYSIFEAYGDMAITILNQLKSKFNLEHFVMMGDMFGNSVLYSRILSKFQLSNPYFSKAIALSE